MLKVFDSNIGVRSAERPVSKGQVCWVTTRNEGQLGGHQCVVKSVRRRHYLGAETQRFTKSPCPYLRLPRCKVHEELSPCFFYKVLMRCTYNFTIFNFTIFQFSNSLHQRGIFSVIMTNAVNGVNTAIRPQMSHAK